METRATTRGQIVITDTGESIELKPITDEYLRLSMSAVKMGEVWYSIARKYSARQADRCIEDIQSMAIEIVAADWALAYQAAHFKIDGKLSYGDCFAAALAHTRDAELVTGDKEFASIEKKHL